MTLFKDRLAMFLRRSHSSATGFPELTLSLWLPHTLGWLSQGTCTTPCVLDKRSD